MKVTASVVLGIVLWGCAPSPATPVANGPPVVLDPATVRQCALIGREIAAQQRNAAFGSVMATPLVQAVMQINADNVIDGLRTRAAIIGCV